MIRNGWRCSAPFLCRSRWCRSGLRPRASRSRVRLPAPAAPGRHCCGGPRTAMLSSRMRATGFSTPRSHEFPGRICSPSASPSSRAWSSMASSSGLPRLPSLPDRTACASSNGPIKRSESMFAQIVVGAARAAFLVLAAAWLIAPAQAQQPTAGALAAAREYLDVKGAKNMFEPVVLGIVEQSKAVYLQTNPALLKDLDEVAAQLRAEYAARAAEQLNEMTKLYAQRSTGAQP